MSHEFSQEEKEVQEFSDRIGFGVTKVKLIGCEAGTTEDGKDFIETVITTDDGIEEKVRSWFTGGASKISFNMFRQVAVHQAKTDETKQAARDAVDAVKNTEELAALMTEKCFGGELWFTKYYDADRTYENTAGQRRRSINTNILGYEPKLKPELMPKGSDGITDLDRKTDDNAVPFESAGDAPGSKAAAPAVPADDAWSGQK